MSHTVKNFFKDYAEALVSFSAEEIAKFYQTPMAVYSDQGVQTVTDINEVISFWQQGVKPYADQGISKAVSKVLSEEQVSETIYLCKVLWENYDSWDTQVSNETNYYILAQKDKEFNIVGLVLKGE
jgi:limonene-1,2-epoxide hydrolase